jgi:hypothetical protein
MFAVFYDLNVIGAKDMNGGLFVYLAEDGQECQNG